LHVLHLPHRVQFLGSGWLRNSRGMTIEAREQLDEMLRQLPLAPRPTSDYQSLLEDTPKDEENHESEDHGSDDPLA
jgi:hypothetical protein